MDFQQHMGQFSRILIWSIGFGLLLAVFGVCYEVWQTPMYVFFRDQEWQWGMLWDTYITYLAPLCLLALPIAYIAIALKNR